MTITPQVGEQFTQQVAADSDNEISQQLAAKLFSVPWGHHMLLIDKAKDDYKKAWFYVCEIIENGWSRNMLLNGLDTNLYERQGHALTNFKRTLPKLITGTVPLLTVPAPQQKMAGASLLPLPPWNKSRVSVNKV